MRQASPFCQNFIAATQNGTQQFVQPPQAWVMLDCVPNETMNGFLGDLNIMSQQ